MADTEDQTEEETVTSEFVGDVTTDATTTDGATTKYESTGDVVSDEAAKGHEIGGARKKRRRRKNFRTERCANEKRIREGESLWRTYMKL